MAEKKTNAVKTTETAKNVKENVKAVEKAAEKKAPAAKKAAAKKEPAKKTAAKKPAEDIVFIETETGTQYNVNAIIASCKQDYKDKGHNTPKNLAVYIKPAERVAYYTVNGKGSDEQKVEF